MKKMFKKIKLNRWLKKISKCPFEEIVDHIKRHAVDHITKEPFDDWIDSMDNLIGIYNFMKNRNSTKNRIDLLQRYKDKHNSNV